MIIRLLNYIVGYVYMELHGEKRERFINLCTKRKISLWKVKNIPEGYGFYIYAKDVRFLREIIKKTGIRPAIKKKYGMPFLLFKHRKRKAFLLGIMTAFAIVYVMSQFIWDISIEGNYSYTKYEIIKLLEENNVFHGMKKTDADCEKIEKLVRNEFFDITWVSVELTGTRLIVHMRENFDDTQSNMKENQNEQVNNTQTGYMLVSEKDAVIESIITRTGKPMVKSGDTVTEGTVLIDGKYDIMGDYEAYIRTQYVKADGDVYGYVVYPYDETIKREYKLKTYTGNEYAYNKIRINDKAADFCFYEADYKEYDRIETEKQCSIVGDFYIPVYISEILCREYVTESVFYTDEELKKAAETKLSIFLENLSKKGIQIIENNVKIEVGTDCVRLTGEIKVLEKLGTLKEVPIIMEDIKKSDE